MAPKKRKDPEDIAPGGSGNPDFGSPAEGQGQPQGNDALDGTPELGDIDQPEDENEQDFEQHSPDHHRQRTVSFDGVQGNPALSNHPSAIGIQDMTLEELELELELKTIRKAILQKKRSSKIPAPQDSAPFDTESVLRERQNERLRRAGLLPPRDTAPRSHRPSAPVPSYRHQSIPSSVIMHGIDRKISDIMSSTHRPGQVAPGDKSELAKAGIKIVAPEKWKGDRSIQVFTDWTQSVAHYFKLHSPLSEILKVDLIRGYLSGDPLDWYWRHVAPHAQQWTATNLMVALRRQYLVDELSRQAADKFESAEQGSKDIHSFQTYLLKLADQMTEYPSPIALNRRLLKGMKNTISSAIVANRGIDAEISGWDEIIQAAMDQERAHRYAGTLNKVAAHRPEERKDIKTTRPVQVSRTPTNIIFNRPRAPVNIQRPNPSFSRPVPSGPPRNSSVSATRPSGPKPTDQCRSCQGFGHWANDCPKRLRTNLIDLEDDGDVQTPSYDDDDEQEPNLIMFDDEEDADNQGQYYDQDPEVDDMMDHPSSDHDSNGRDEEVPLACNCISTATIMSNVRESNISSSKPRFGDPANSPASRPPLVLLITGTVSINGHKAKALFDSGSTADLISASFVDAHKISNFKLKEPSPLQLAITGSRGKINRACIVELTHGSCKQQKRYFDILNIDRYDAILGTSYQKDFGVMLDIATNEIVYKRDPGQKISAAVSAAKNAPENPSTLSAFGIASSKLDKILKKPRSPVIVKVTETFTEESLPVDSSSITPLAFTAELEDHITRRLRETWMETTKDLWGPRPLTLPPFREINHSIPLIKEDYKPFCRPAKCPEQYREAYLEKINTYTSAGWWQRASVPAAMPMMVIPKKDGRIRTVVDARQRNDNTVKDVTPFPDQDVIRRDVARAKYRSKLDQTDFFEQIRVVTEDIWKTAFATPFGTFVSLVAQQGDCNVPSTAQQLVMYLFRKHIGKFVHVYLDDTFIFSDSIEEHEEHLGLIFKILREAKLYLSKDKMDLYSTSMMCLGHVIDDKGLHADEDKLSKIIAWKEMKTVKEVQRFLGLMQYLAQFFPNLSTMTGPISKLTHKGQPFEWGPLQVDCLARLQRAAANAPILKPIDPAHNKDPIFVVTDASTSGVGALYGQGPSWQAMRPAGFHSRKFNSAQMNYRTHEQELLAVLEALMKWEDQLLGREFVIITDHRSLEYLQTQRTLSGRQVRWLEYLSKFTYKIRYVAGETNVVADYLSRFWEDPAVPTQAHDFVNADARLDQDSDDAPHPYTAAILTRVQSSTAATDGDSTTSPSLAKNRPGPINVNGFTDDVGPVVRAAYQSDSFFSKIWAHPEDHSSTFEISDKYVWFKQKDSDSRSICIPGVLFKGRRVTELLIDNAHKSLGHLGSVKTLTELRRYFFWPTMVKDVESFCRSCGTCAVTKRALKAPAGKLHSLRVPDRPWLGIALDFVGPLPQSNGFDFLLVVIDRLSSMVHLIPTVMTVTASQSARLVFDNIVRLHGLPESIVSDQDTRWKSTFWQELHRLLNIRLLFSTAYHPQTDGATESANRTAIQILRSTVQSDQTDWVDRLTTTEFAMNSQVNASTGFSPFELLYGFNPTMSRNLGSSAYVSPFKGVKEYHERINLNLMAAHDNIIAARTRQTTQANKHRAETTQFRVNDLVYLSTINLKLPSGRAAKLLPRYIGPYKIVKCFSERDAFTLALPQELIERRIHPTFHSSLLKPHVPNDDKLFPGRDPKAFYDFGIDEEEEWNVDDILAHRWMSAKLQLLVQWSTGDKTWEPIDNCNRLSALTKYLELHGVMTPDLLPQASTTPSLVRS
ncbi:hypothetical protein A4X06_0g5596 [Tilletia controversa]|uniref:RNA-directed DNA polymerase n=1 Tax=Tilletia controversa TaxID=13291 RepID=A0A8X7SW09_9BASI|nr:hypothetical protein A4X06_0g5596 [Tilletia controversa]